jgi:hypothetical protein
MGYSGVRDIAALGNEKPWSLIFNPEWVKKTKPILSGSSPLAFKIGVEQWTSIAATSISVLQSCNLKETPLHFEPLN